jgi:hypothetical protein
MHEAAYIELQVLGGDPVTAETMPGRADWLQECALRANNPVGVPGALTLISPPNGVAQ